MTHRHQDHTTTPTPLFIMGLGRSGTTALVETFCAHPRVALGIERYKRWTPEFELTPAHFTAARFFDFSDGLTNIVPESDARWREHYERMAAKWEGAAYVGDKLTRIRARRIWATLPDARFVFVVRDIASVAHSWQVRARDDEDSGWSATADARASVVRWNRSLRQIERAVSEHPELTMVVEHGDFFGDPRGRRLRQALEWLELDQSPLIHEKFEQMHVHYRYEVAPKSRRLAPADADFLSQAANWSLWERVMGLAQAGPVTRPPAPTVQGTHEC